MSTHSHKLEGSSDQGARQRLATAADPAGAVFKVRADT